MASNHTPGPWKMNDLRHQRAGKIKIEHDCAVSGQYGLTSHVANVMSRSECADGNANLIAAAPELLEACEALLRALPSEFNGSPELRQAHEAISKARGRA